MKFGSASIHSVVAVLAGLLLAGQADAQVLRQQTVQLPTFEVFSTSTTVIVPDSGTVYLGGVNRSRLGRNSLGVPFGGPGLGNRGFGRASLAGSLGISATIIDHDALDRAVLAEAARRRGAKFDVLGRPVPARGASNPVRRNASRGSNPNASRGLAADPRLAVTYMERGQRAEAEGQPNMAKVFYRRVLKHGNQDLKDQAQQRLAHLASPAS